MLPTFQPPPVNTHTVQSFRDNLLPILNKLVIEGKIDTDWINNTKATHFNNMDAIHWAKNEAASESLFNTFIQRGYRDWGTDRKSTRLNSSHSAKSRMPSSA